MHSNYISVARKKSVTREKKWDACDQQKDRTYPITTDLFASTNVYRIFFCIKLKAKNVYIIMNEEKVLSRNNGPI